MSDTDLLTMVKANIQMASSAYNNYLTQLINVSKSSIREYGILLDPNDIADCNLVVMYTSYLWSKRLAADSAMPRMLTHALRNRLFSAQMRGD